VTSLEVLRIVLSIGGAEIMHFQTWSDKAGNAPPLRDVVDPVTGVILDSALLGSFYVFTPTFDRGLFVAAGDVVSSNVGPSDATRGGVKAWPSAGSGRSPPGTAVKDHQGTPTVPSLVQIDVPAMLVRQDDVREALPNSRANCSEVDTKVEASSHECFSFARL
jgi:hypothetical protein